MSTRRRRPALTAAAAPVNPDAVTPARREETLPIGLAAMVAGFFALALSARSSTMLLYGDAVAHLGIARRILDTNTPGLQQLGGVWLPLPHLLMLPFIGRMDWWRNGMAGAWPSLVCYIVAAMGMYRLARRMVPARWALAATGFFALNANLLYLSTTAMTEPLFLALFIWIILLTLELTSAFSFHETPASKKAVILARPESQYFASETEALRVIRSRFYLLGILNLAATMTRYDGWILAAAVWLIAALHLYRRPDLRARLLPAFAAMTLLTAAGPAFWFWYNRAYGHDWLDFMRGPYSAKEIDRKTSPPGSHKYWGWHNPAWSLMLYARTAQVDAAWWELGWPVAAAALYGTWKACKQRADRAWLLLWLPLPFYVYSISYGSVPIFIPQLYPHSYYNSRYGMEMLPVLALLLTYAAWQLTRSRPLGARLGVPIALLLVAVNTVLMLHATPLVLKEAMVNSRSRLAVEEPLSTQLQLFRAGSTILMENSNHVGALQMAGIPLRQTIGPDDYYRWRAGLADPAATADYVISFDGDELSRAIAAHPQGLDEIMILGTFNQPSAHLYRSTRHAR